MELYDEVARHLLDNLIFKPRRDSGTILSLITNNILEDKVAAIDNDELDYVIKEYGAQESVRKRVLKFTQGNLSENKHTNW